MKNAMTTKEYALTAVFSLVYKAGCSEYPYASEFVPVGSVNGEEYYVAISCWAHNPELVYFAHSERTFYASNEREYLDLPCEVFECIKKYVCGESFDDKPYSPMGYAVKLTDAHKAMKGILKYFSK